MTRSSTRVFDAVIVGGGPAGAATAIALSQRGLTAAIVDRAPEPVARVGETLPPDVRRPLETLGVWDRFAAADHDPAIGNRSYWGSSVAGDFHFIATPYGSGWHIDRRRFEAMLLAEARARGVLVFAGRPLHDVCRDRHRWTVRIPEPLGARFVVDASGRASALARCCGVQRMSIDQLVAATTFLEPLDRSTDGQPDPHGRFTVIEATPDGWWYSAPLPQRRLVVACMTDADLAARLALRGRDGWLSAARRTRATRDRVESYSVGGTPRLASANTARLSSVVGPSWLAVGDAAVSFDPLSSQGIITALECAIDAAIAIAAHLSGDTAALYRYAQAITDRYRRYLVERAQYYGVERRWPASPFWQRRQAHHEILHHAAAS
ncbi:MAG TPA: tryptophan 7-halogenase [Vicinamibacterales bacterium]|nr:tryptophan 7-halogenase [Vicinamibacterales bacterium]